MRKILGSWSGMRKYLEQEMLAESLKGRVRYGCTSYVGMDGCRIFEVCIDKEQLKRFSWETVNSYFFDNGYTYKGAKEFFEKLIGDGSIRGMIARGMTADEIKATWADDVEIFKIQRKPYLLYLE